MISIGITYRLYGRMTDMKRFKAVSGNSFTSNLIHAELYSPKTEGDVKKMENELRSLNNQGQFEFREV